LGFSQYFCVEYWAKGKSNWILSESSRIKPYGR